LGLENVPEEFLYNYIEKGIFEGVTASNFESILAFAHQHDMTNLENTCKSFLLKNKSVLSQINVKDLAEFAHLRNMGWLLMLLLTHCEEQKITLPPRLQAFKDFVFRYGISMSAEGQLRTHLYEQGLLHLLQDPSRKHIHSLKLSSLSRAGLAALCDKL